MKDEFDVTVICTVPSYTGRIEDKYKANKFYKEQINGVKVIRVPVPEFTKASRVSRIKNLMVYYCNARKVTRKLGHFDYVFTISQEVVN